MTEAGRDEGLALNPETNADSDAMKVLQTCGSATVPLREVNRASEGGGMPTVLLIQALIEGEPCGGPIYSTSRWEV